jgi:5'-methylthioadenosine phosphorylase
MKIGVIGGSGLYDLDCLTDVTSVRVETPFGEPSDEFVRGMLGEREVYFLPRHGKGHRLLPSELNHRANIWAFKSLGVEHVISISAVGSLREEYRPRDIVLPDQYFDRTKQSLAHTFFGDGLVGHVAFGDPACASLRDVIAEACRRAVATSDPAVDTRVTEGGTYVNMEGPAFSTRAESNAYRQLGFDIIGMTAIGEAKLCREAEICYQTVAFVTDYDCWHAGDDVSVDMVIGHLSANVALAKRMLSLRIPEIPATRACPCASALASALMTDHTRIPAETLARLEPIVGKYVTGPGC